MDVGLCLPYFGHELDRNTILTWCRSAEESGFASLSCGERVTGDAIEMRTTLGAAAAVTERVRIVPTLYIVPMHAPVQSAKEIATLDVLSGGRVTVTVGVGGRPNDYASLGASLERRQARMAEGVAEWRRLWAGEPPFEGCDPIGPRPVQAGGPKIHAGVMLPTATRKACNWADGFYLWSGNGQRAEIERMIGLVNAGWEEAGREGRPRIVAGFWFSLAQDSQQKLQQYVFDYVKTLGEAGARAMAKTMNRSSADAVRESLDDMAAIGCDECFLVPATSEPVEVERAAEIVAAR